MSLIVQKFGGTSVADPDLIKKAARRAIKRVDRGDNVVVVVSAMKGVTDNLIEIANRVTLEPEKRELDVLLSTGEQTTAAIMAITLNSMGYPAVSLLGFQIKILTDSVFGNARIISIEKDFINQYLEKNRIVIVAGFQGCTANGEITTLGRGGSDTSAVALSVALKADLCEIYTDVNGVYTADPNICKKARKIKKISYDEMLNMSSLGAKVLQIRSVGFARKFNIPIHVRSSFSEEEGTMVTSEMMISQDSSMEHFVVSGVTQNKNEARITLTKVPDQPGVAAKIFSPIADEGIIIDMIIQNTYANGGYTDLTFTVPKENFERAMEIEKRVAKEIGAKDVFGDQNIAKVSVIGVGMKNHSGVASTMFKSLAKENINIIMISTSEIRISCVIEEKYTELAVRTLHTAFGLDQD